MTMPSYSSIIFDSFCKLLKAAGQAYFLLEHAELMKDRRRSSQPCALLMMPHIIVIRHI